MVPKSHSRINESPDMLLSMAWSQQEKEAARNELQRRRNSYTAGACHRGMLKAGILASVCILIVAMGTHSIHSDPDWVVRVEAVITFLLGLTGIIFAMALAYRRYRDWRYFHR
jgi:hypothetical protein